MRSMFSACWTAEMTDEKGTTLETTRAFMSHLVRTAMIPDARGTATKTTSQHHVCQVGIVRGCMRAVHHHASRRHCRRSSPVLGAHPAPRADSGQAQEVRSRNGISTERAMAIDLMAGTNTTPNGTATETTRVRNMAARVVATATGVQTVRHRQCHTTAGFVQRMLVVATHSQTHPTHSLLRNQPTCRSMERLVELKQPLMFSAYSVPTSTGMEIPYSM